MKKLTLMLFLLAIFACSRHVSLENEISSSSQEDDGTDTLAYKIVEIGSQIWFAENLNDMPRAGNWWCYGDCDEYGKLYDWEAANNACPNGWKLPSRDDYNILREYVESESKGLSAGYLLKSGEGWGSYGGSDAYSFSALPGGFKNNDNDIFVSRGEGAYWWSSSEYGEAGTQAYYYWIGNDKYLNSTYNKKTQGLSVRCIKR